MILEQGYARDIAEALLDAVQMVSELSVPVAVIDSGSWVVATRVFDTHEAIIIVVPDEDDPISGLVPAYILEAA
jgi:hypothetical protein